jgi:sterol desaturase/sphingolipid hydroxylase (fatty acid hydroxylase superfamily)
MDIKYAQILSLAVVFGLQYLLEHVYPQKKTLNDWKNERFNLLVGFLNIVLTFIPAGLFVQLIEVIQYNRLGLFHRVSLPGSILFLLTIIILDLWMYAWHRLNHQVPFLWRLHRFHHKDQKMNSTTALRFHTAELFLSYPGKALVCFIFGISYTPLLVYEILFFSGVVLHHSNIRISERADAIYRLLFASPLMHRVHHSNKWADTNANFGALFSFWDRLFRSWKDHPGNAVEFGIPED